MCTPSVHACAHPAHTCWHPPCTEVSALVYVHRGRARECTNTLDGSALMCTLVHTLHARVGSWHPPCTESALVYVHGGRARECVMAVHRGKCTTCIRAWNGRARECTSALVYVHGGRVLVQLWQCSSMSPSSTKYTSPFS